LLKVLAARVGATPATGTILAFFRKRLSAINIIIVFVAEVVILDMMARCGQLVV